MTADTDHTDRIPKLGPYELGPRGRGIYTGDAKLLAKAIPDNSVDLIFTDPLYDRIDDYAWLGREAARVLKNDRACLVWSGTPELPLTIAALNQSLDWAWLMYWQRYGYMAPSRAGICVITPCLWFEKGKSKTYIKIADWVGTANTAGARTHKWGKPLELVRKWVHAFTPENGVVWDPFAGGASVPVACKQLGYKSLGFEIDPDTAQSSRERVENTQPPLFSPSAQQVSMY